MCTHKKGVKKEDIVGKMRFQIREENLVGKKNGREKDKVEKRRTIKSKRR